MIRRLYKTIIKYLVYFCTGFAIMLKFDLYKYLHILWKNIKYHQNIIYL